MTQVDTRPHVTVDFLVRLRVEKFEFPFVLQRNARGEQRAIDELKQRIDVHIKTLTETRANVERSRIYLFPVPVVDDEES